MEPVGGAPWRRPRSKARARLGEAFTWDDVVAGSETVDLDGLGVRVASARLLHRMKRDTVRPQDRLDAARIREAFGWKDD